MRIGIAGYMGAGKTTCARAFVSEHAEVIDADARAKALMSADSGLRDGLCAVFGDTIADGRRLRFDVLGKLVFASAESLRLFNGVVHPALIGEFERIVHSCAKPLCILDAALIPLWRVERWFDLCVWVEAPFEERLRRLTDKLPDMGEDELRRRMSLQQEIMPVPICDQWIKLPSGECREYIRDRLR